MACNHCASEAVSRATDMRWRKALWVALAVNGAMFAVELGAGFMADSKSLQADALDFFSDAANYAISLGVAGLALAWRARAALFKGLTLLLLGAYVIGTAVLAALQGSAPEPFLMGGIGVAALVANVTVAIMLFRWRAGDANMQSVWICSRNDAIANIAVVAAALGVFGTGTRWPDLVVAGLMAALSFSGGWRIVRLAAAELRTTEAHASAQR